MTDAAPFPSVHVRSAALHVLARLPPAALAPHATTIVHRLADRWRAPDDWKRFLKNSAHAAWATLSAPQNAPVIKPLLSE